MSGSRGVWIESHRGSSEEESEVHVIRIHHDSVVGSSEYFLHGRRRCVILRVETNLCPFHSQRGCEEMHHAAGCAYFSELEPVQIFSEQCTCEFLQRSEFFASEPSSELLMRW